LMLLNLKSALVKGNFDQGTQARLPRFHLNVSLGAFNDHRR